MSETKRWLITGVSSGIGSALAEAVLKRGDFIIGCARGEADVAKFDALAPGQTKGVQLDLSRIETIQPAVDKILRTVRWTSSSTTLVKASTARSRKSRSQR